MDISDIIKDSLKYPVSDFKKLLILGIPNLIMAILLLILGIQAIGLESLENATEEAIISSPVFTSFLTTFLLFMVIVVIIGIINSGIEISVIRETIKPSDELPTLSPITNFVDGIKNFVIALIYIGVPILIFVLIMSAITAIFQDYAGMVLVLLTLLLVIVSFLLTCIYMTAICKLAETNSLSEALKIREIFELTKKIGFGKILVVIVICAIISYIVSFIGSFISMIPIIGFIIFVYIIYTYSFLMTSRAYGLTYKDINEENYNPFQQGPVNPNKQIDTYEESLENNETDNLKLEQTQSTIDFEPEKDDVQELETEDKDEDITLIKKCSKCGYSNPEYAKICVNCGNEL